MRAPSALLFFLPVLHALMEQVAAANASALVLHDAIVFEAWNGTEVVPQHALTLLASSSDAVASFACAAGPLSVQVLISTCFSAMEVATIDTWVQSQLIDASPVMHVDDAPVDVKYAVKFVAPSSGDSCGDPAQLATALEHLTAEDYASPAAVLSFVTDSCDLLDSEAASLEMQFRYCPSSATTSECTSTSGTDKRVPDLSELYKYNPKLIARLLPCASTTDAVAIPYKDADGKRQCVCTCPDGTELSGSNCALSTSPLGGGVVKGTGFCPWVSSYSCSWDDPTAASLKLHADCDVPVVVPTDNYVAHGRTNKNDNENPLTSPAVTLSVSKRGSPASPGSITKTWKAFVENPATELDTFSLDAPGVYDVEIEASDYRATKACDTCVVVNDDVRPKFTADCPASFSTNLVDNPETFSPEKAAAAASLAENFGAFVESVSNNANSGDRRDDSSISQRDYFQTALQEHSGSCFDASTFEAEFRTYAAAKTNPLSGDQLTGTTAALSTSLAGQCVRYCEKTVAPRELVTPYSCDASETTTPECSPAGTGATETCSFEHCVAIKSDSYFAAAAEITSDAQALSDTVAKALPAAITFDAAKELHRTTSCTAFDAADANCAFQDKLKNLINPTASWGANAPSDTTEDAADFVFWRYKTTGGSWAAWQPGAGDEAEVTISTSSTALTIEAWSQYGLVASSRLTSSCTRTARLTFAARSATCSTRRR